MTSSTRSEKIEQIPNWIAREKARNLQKRRTPDIPSDEWRSFGKAVEFNTKRMLITLRDANRPVAAIPVGWRICCWQCVEHFRQINRRLTKRWQTRYYMESRKFRERSVIRTEQMERYILRSYTEVSRMEKYLAGNPLAKIPDCKTWSMAGKRAYERINHPPRCKTKKNDWQDCFRLILLTMNHFGQNFRYPLREKGM